MILWHVKFTTYGFSMNAVVAAPDYSEAIGMLKLGVESRLKEARPIGETLDNHEARIITEDTLLAGQPQRL